MSGVKIESSNVGLGDSRDTDNYWTRPENQARRPRAPGPMPFNPSRKVDSCYLAPITLQSVSELGGDIFGVIGLARKEYIRQLGNQYGAKPIDPTIMRWAPPPAR